MLASIYNGTYDVTLKEAEHDGHSAIPNEELNLFHVRTDLLHSLK